MGIRVRKIVSPRFSFRGTFKKIVKGAGIAIGGAALAWLEQMGIGHLTNALAGSPPVDWGLTPYISSAIGAIATNAGIKFVGTKTEYN